MQSISKRTLDISDNLMLFFSNINALLIFELRPKSNEEFSKESNINKLNFNG